MTKTPRERMVVSAVQLIRSQGVSATGLRQVVAHADAPRGSLQHYFPGGKEQLVDEAIAWAGSYMVYRMAGYAAASPTPGDMFAAMSRQWRDEFLSSGYTAGCPLVAATADTAAASERLRTAVSRAFTGWQEPIAGELIKLGVPAARSGPLALLMLSALEGAIVLARAHRDVTPLDTVAEELRPLLDAAVTSG